MDEYKPINVHGILLTAVHDGGTGKEYSTSRWITFIAYQTQQLRDLEELRQQWHTRNNRPSNDNNINKYVWSGLDTKLRRQLRESFHWSIIYTVPICKSCLQRYSAMWTQKMQFILIGKLDNISIKLVAW